MRFFLTAIILLFCAPALAQAPAGFEKFYDAPTRVNLGGRPVIADLEFHKDPVAERQGILRIALVTDVTKFVVETEQDLKNWVARQRKDCGNRWNAGKPRITFPESAIRFAIYLEFEYWSCGWNGKGQPARIALETGTADVTLSPYIEDGKLQARLGGFSLSDQSGISKYLPLEFVVRRSLEQELKKLNNNPKFYRAPKPLFDDNFVYEGISAAKTEDGRIIITALYKTTNAQASLDRIVQELRTTGVTQ